MTLRGIRKDIKPGKIVLSTVGTGALRQVESTSVAAGNTVLQTTQASLTDAFESLHFQASLPFTRQQIGDINSNVPGLSFQWVSGDSTNVATSDAELNKLEIQFDGLSLDPALGLSFTGTATLSAQPECAFDIDQASGDVQPSFSSLHAGLRAQLSGSVTTTSTSGGDLSVAKKWFDQAIGTPIVAGYFVFVPHLKIQSSLSGTAEGALTHEQGLQSSGSASADYKRGSGWSTPNEFSSQITANESDVEGEFGIVSRPVEVTLSFDLYDIAGPYASLFPEVNATGTRTVQDSFNGIDAVVEASGGGKIGLTASTPEAFSELFEASWTAIDVSSAFTKAEIFHKFYPKTPIAPPNEKFVGKWRLPEIGMPETSGFDVLFNADNTFQIYKNGAEPVSASGTYSVVDGFLTGDWHHVSGPLYGKVEAFFESEGVMRFSFIELNTTNPASDNGYLRTEHRGQKAPIAPPPIVQPNARFVGKWRLPEIGMPETSGFDVLFNADNTFLIYKNGAGAVSADGTYSVLDDFLTGDWHHVSGPLYGEAEAFFESEGVMHFSFIELNTTNPASDNGYLRTEHRGWRIE